MEIKICDRCKNVYTESISIEVVIDIGIGMSKRKFDLCRDCKKWLYKELGVKEDKEEEV